MGKKLARSSEFEREYSDGERICSEGESSSEMFVIQRGQVRISKQSSRGDVELAVLGKGDFFGEMSVLEGMPRDASAEASGVTRVLVMSPGALLVRLRRDPTFAFELLRRVSGRVRNLNARLLEALDRDAPPSQERDALLYQPEEDRPKPR